jgi:hypothetical protein
MLFQTADALFLINPAQCKIFHLGVEPSIGLVVIGSNTARRILRPHPSGRRVFTENDPPSVLGTKKAGLRGRLSFLAVLQGRDLIPNAVLTPR